MAHNVSTVERDLDMFRPLLEAREETKLLEYIQHAHAHLKAAYSLFLTVFETEVMDEVRNHGDHDHGDHSHERAPEELVKQAKHDADLARRFMTR